MKKWLFVFLLFPFALPAQSFVELEDSVLSNDLKLYGTLCLPESMQEQVPLMIIVSGSGPTDRNCNSAMGLKSNAFIKLAHHLASQNIATFRYDKRGVGKSTGSSLKESELRFDDMVKDCKAIVAHFEKDKRFKQLTIAGHSEGALVALLSVQADHRYISICGPADNAADLLKDQLKGQLGAEREQQSFNLLDSLKSGKEVECKDPQLQMIFRSSVQPYLISWFKYTPSELIKQHQNPSLIIVGGNDIQVSAQQGEKMKAANPKSELLVIPSMNHVLVETTAANKMENMKTYNQPELPLSKTLLDKLSEFMLKN